MVRAGRIVTRRLGRPAADEHGARVGDPGGRRLGIGDVDRQVLRGVRVHEVDGLVHVACEHDPPVLRERPLEDRAPKGGGEALVDLDLDGIGERLVGGHEDGRRVGAVLGLRDEVGGDGARVGVGVGEDEPLGRAGGQIDRDLPGDLELGGRDPRVPGSDDPVDRCEADLRQPEGERADGLGAAGDEERLDAQEPGGSGKDRVDGAVAIGGGGDDDASDAGDLRGDDGHDQRRRVRRAAARHVAADAPKRGPAPLELDARDGLDARPGGPLRLGEPADVRDRGLEGVAKLDRKRVEGGVQDRGIECQAAVRSPAAVALAQGGDGRGAAGPDLVEDGARAASGRPCRGRRRAGSASPRRPVRPDRLAWRGDPGAGGGAPGPWSRDDLLDGQDEDARRPGRLEARQEAPDLVGCHDGVDRDHARRARAG